MTTIAERLRQLRIKAGYKSVVEAARAHGWHEPTYRSHENGHRNPPRDMIVEYAKTFKVSIAWLTTGREDTGKGQSVPFLDWAKLPRKREGRLSQQPIFEEPQRVLVLDKSVGPDAGALDILDESMVSSDNDRRSLYVGDSIVIDGDLRIRPGNLVLIYDPQQEMHCVRIAEFRSHDKIEFVALNPAFPPTRLPSDSKHILGVVTRVQRAFA